KDHVNEFIKSTLNGDRSGLHHGHFRGVIITGDVSVEEKAGLRNIASEALPDPKLQIFDFMDSSFAYAKGAAFCARNIARRPLEYGWTPLHGGLPTFEDLRTFSGIELP